MRDDPAPAMRHARPEPQAAGSVTSLLSADALGPGVRDRVRSQLLAELRADEVTALRTDVVYGTAWRPR